MEKKINVGIICGGRSAEHEVSIVSAASILNALDKNKYNTSVITIDKNGQWHSINPENFLSHAKSVASASITGIATGTTPVSLIPYKREQQVVEVINNVNQSNSGLTPTNSKQRKEVPGSFDVIFPVLHGTYGEDGTIQGLFELANIPYVGSGVIGSALGMDKELSRKLFKAAGIPTVPTVAIRKSEFLKNSSAIFEKLQNELGYPYFIKPANAGSSIGVFKIKSLADCKTSFEKSFQYDVKILAEKAIDARELEVSVLGNNEPKASIVGELLPKHEFYSYEAKYLDPEGALIEIPAKNISPEITKKIQTYAIEAFKALECRGLARVDFFLDKKTNALYLNEINTIPGFTQISMYPKMWEASGVSYSKLIDELIRLAIENFEEKNSLKTTF